MSRRSHVPRSLPAQAGRGCRRALRAQAHDGTLGPSLLQRRLDHRQRHLRHPRRRHSQGRARRHAVLRPRCRGRALLCAVVRRVGQHHPGERVVVLLCLRHPRRDRRVGGRLDAHARVRRRGGGSRRRVGGVPQRVPRILRRDDPGAVCEPSRGRWCLQRSRAHRHLRVHDPARSRSIGVRQGQCGDGADEDRHPDFLHRRGPHRLQR